MCDFENFEFRFLENLANKVTHLLRVFLSEIKGERMGTSGIGVLQRVFEIKYQPPPTPPQKGAFIPPSPPPPCKSTQWPKHQKNSTFPFLPLTEPPGVFQDIPPPKKLPSSEKPKKRMEK